MNDFSKVLKEERAKRKESQLGMSIELNISQDNVCRYEQGKMEPKISEAERILNILGYDLVIVKREEE